MILYYSGTGNSAFAAKYISEQTGDRMMNLFDALRGSDHTPLSSNTPWVIVTPTYAWRIPRIVEKWLRNTPLTGSRDIYFILTCGSETGNAAQHARKLAKRMQMCFRGCMGVVMPENYIALFNAPEEKFARAQVRWSTRKLKPAAQAILSGADFPAEKVKFKDRLLSGPVNPLFYVFIVKDKKFRTGSACTGCGKCERLCPTGNISLKDTRPVWHGNCTHCMACICSCPTQAIEYGKASIGKARYTCPQD